MKQLRWRILVCVVPVLAALAYLTPQLLKGPEGFRLGVDLAGGTILVYEVVHTDDESQLKPEELAAKIKRRIDPTDLLNITVRPIGKTRVEIILPTGGVAAQGKGGQSITTEGVRELKRLIAQTGSLEFRFLANSRDDAEAIEKAEAYFKDPTPERKAELERLAREGKPPLAPKPSPENVFKAEDGKEHTYFDTPKGRLTYSWVELGKQERIKLNVDNDAETDTNRNAQWQQAAEARKRGVPMRPDRMSGALLWSREQIALNPPPDERDKKYEYFILTRDPERDPVTGIPKAITGENLGTVGEGRDKIGMPAITFKLDSKGGDLFHDLTTKNVPDKRAGDEFYRYLAILVDGKIVSAPTLNEAIRSEGIISGKFTSDEVISMVRVLRSGALPTKLKPEPVSENTMGPTLGKETVERGTLAVGLSFVVVLIFMVVYYRFAGFVASVALLANLILTVAAMTLVNATFTLPGLAGLVLMLGMAVDANVLIYERLREERERGASLQLALRNGYDRAFPTIIDTHLTSIFTSIVLWAIGNDQLKGFGISLTIGLVISLFTSLYMTRVLFDIWMTKGWLHKLTMARWVPHTNIDFMRIRYYWFTATIVLTFLGVAVFLMRGKDGLNIDFNGGVAYGGRLAEPMDIGDLRELLSEERQKTVLKVSKVEQLDEDGRSYNIIYADGAQRTVQLPKSATPAQLQERAELLPDMSVEQIFLSKFSEGTKTPFFTIRTGEMAPDLVQASITRLLGDKLKRIELTKFTVHDDRKTVTLEFSDDASPAQVRSLLERNLTALGMEEETRQMGLSGEKGTDVDGLFKKMTVAFAAPVDLGKLEKALTATQREFKDQPQPERLEAFDTQLAQETQLRALYAVLASWGAILIYLWFRFGNWTFGLAAVLCLVHDLLFTLGLIAGCHYLHGTWLGNLLLIQDFKIDFAAVAALLTLVGYSVNDTIVVFDRIREVRGKNPTLTPQMINDSVNQTLSRTLLTSFITWLVVLVLYIWGGGGVHLFAFVMVVGVIVGTYSSIYIASPLLLIFGEGTKPSTVREQRAQLSPEGAAV